MSKKAGKKRSTRELAEKLTFRLDEAIADLVAEYSEETGISPNLIGRMATVLMMRNRFHEFPARLKRLEENNDKLNDSIIRLIKEFNDAVYDEAA